MHDMYRAAMAEIIDCELVDFIRKRPISGQTLGAQGPLLRYEDDYGPCVHVYEELCYASTGWQVALSTGSMVLASFTIKTLQCYSKKCYIKGT